MNKKGKVYLVGAGPGDPNLITVKGLNCIREADVIIYDRLVNPILLKEAKEDVELKYVGKSADHHTLTQDKINELIVKEALQGKVVTRLKGGDPFIFGRGGEEAEELVQVGISFEIVPGITSAIAVPAYAGIPLTHRKLTSMVSLITGHEDPTKEDSVIDWEQLARGNGTLVFLMGVGNLNKIVGQLIKFGRSEKTPIGLIQWGTRPEQKTVTGDLSNIVERVHKAGITSPAIIVVGEVVGLREKLSWFEEKPLFRKKILVTRSRHQASGLREKLMKLGAQVIESPTIAIAPPNDWKVFDKKLKHLGEYQWVIFTSINGVEQFIQRLFSNGLDVRALGNARLAAIGSATAERLKNYGLRVDFVPDKYIAEDLAQGLSKICDLKDTKILLPRAQKARVVLPEILQKAGAYVDEVAVYQTVLGEGIEDLGDLLKEGKIDAVTFTSSSTAQNLAELLKPNSFVEVLKGVDIACIGPVTAKTVKDLGGHVSLIAEEYTIDGLIETLCQHYGGGIDELK